MYKINEKDSVIITADLNASTKGWSNNKESVPFF